MPRSIRIEYPGAFYHVTARGNRRERIYVDDQDRLTFLRVLGEACEMTGWQVHAWVLMGNHYHLVIQTPEPNLVAGMKWLQNTYTRRFNVRHQAWGRLFGDRYKAVLADGSGRYYYETLLDYVHLNPVRAGIIKPRMKQSILDYPWSSLAKGYAVPPRSRPGWLACPAGLAMFGFADTTGGRRKMVERLDERAVAEDAVRCGVPLMDDEFDARCSHLRRGWYWGTQEFAEKVLALSKSMLGRPRGRDYVSSREKRAHDMVRAKELLYEGLQRAALRKEDLAELRADARKVAIAMCIRRLTTVPNGWLAGTFHMKSAANVSQQIRRFRVQSSMNSLPKELRAWVVSLGLK